jgi:hypothetical protein
MSEEKNPEAPQDESSTDAPRRTKPGGFGAFSEKYRARWAAGHPEMNRPWPEKDATRAPESTAIDGAGEPAADPIAIRPRSADEK